MMLSLPLENCHGFVFTPGKLPWFRLCSWKITVLLFLLLENYHGFVSTFGKLPGLFSTLGAGYLQYDV